MFYCLVLAVFFHQWLKMWGKLIQKELNLHYERLQKSLPRITIFYIVSRDMSNLFDYNLVDIIREMH